VLFRSLLPKANLMKGKKVTSFKMKNNWSHDEIIKEGGIIIDSPVVIDGNIITCRDEHDAEMLAKSLVQLIKE
jgi:putative intracellular protease/amidase